MTTQKRKNTSAFPLYKYGLGTAAAGLIILGMLFDSGFLFTIGIVSGIIWAYGYQKQHSNVRIYWYILVLLIVIPIVYITIKDVLKFSK